jgi:hypothetical protein
MALRVQALEIERLRVFYRSRPGADLVTARFDVVSMRAEPIEGPLEVEIRGHLDGGPFDLKGRFGSLDELLDPTEPYPARVEGRILEAELQADGTVAEPRRLRGVDLAVSGRIPDLALLSESLDRELPKTGPVAVDVRLVNPDGRFALLDLRLATERPGPLGVVLTGSIRDLRELRGVDLDLELRAEGTDVLQALAERNIGGIGLLDADLVVSDADGTLGVEGEVHARGRDDSITLDLEGGQDDLSRIREIDVRAGLRARDIRVIADALGVEKSLPPIGPVVATGRFRDHDGAVGLYDIDVRVGSRDEAWAELSGSVADVINMAGLEIEARFGAVDLRHARHFLEREPPAIGGLEGMARASDRDGSLGIEHFTIGAGTHELVRIDVSGSFDHLREVDEITLQARVSARDLELFGQLLNADLPSIGPVEFEGSVTGSNESMKSRGTARLDATILKGRWSESFATGERTRIWGRVTSPHVRLRDVGIEPRHRDRSRSNGYVRSMPTSSSAPIGSPVVPGWRSRTSRSAFGWRMASSWFPTSTGPGTGARSTPSCASTPELPIRPWSSTGRRRGWTSAAWRLSWRTSRGGPASSTLFSPCGPRGAPRPSSGRTSRGRSGSSCATA